MTQITLQATKTDTCLAGRSKRAVLTEPICFTPVLVDMPTHRSHACTCVCADNLSLICLLAQDFYEDIFEEVDKFGEIEHLNICDNLADHMVGNVYIKFK